MPCEWAMPHMIAGVTAAPRWTCSSVSGVAGTSLGRGIRPSVTRSPACPGRRAGGVADARIAGPMDAIRQLIEWIADDSAGFVATLLPYGLLGLAALYVAW